MFRILYCQVTDSTRDWHEKKKVQKLNLFVFILGRIKRLDVLRLYITSFFVKMLFIKEGFSPENFYRIQLIKYLYVYDRH